MLCVCVCVCGLVLVAFHVQGQVIGAGETAAAGRALEGLGSCVLAVVPGQLVRAGETPVTALPATAVRFLS